MYQHGRGEHRHGFGKTDGTAAYSPHYVVHYPDAEYSMEKVTKGYRLALIYSICLPMLQSYLKRDPTKSMAYNLASVIKDLEPKDDSFALLLRFDYNKRGVEEYGVQILRDIDKNRLGILEEANTVVPADKKLQFSLQDFPVSVTKGIVVVAAGAYVIANVASTGTQ